MTTYLRDSEGKYIPATQRPDGTWRKARRVKDGYVPQEEVPLYESKGKQFAQSKNNLPVGMCPLIAAAANMEREKKERAKSKKQTAAAGELVAPTKAYQQSHVEGAAANTNAISSAYNKTVSTTKPAKATDKTSNNNTNINLPQNTIATITALSNDLAEMQLQRNDNHQQEDLEKKLKKLKKKLREIESIEGKIKSGELKKPEKDQLDKVKRKKDIVKEIRELEGAFP